MHQKSLKQHGDIGKEYATTQEPEEAKERNNAISVSQNAGKENVQIPMSEKIIRLKNCSVTTQEPEDAKERNNAIPVSENVGNENVQIPMS